MRYIPLALLICIVPLAIFANGYRVGCDVTRSEWEKRYQKLEYDHSLAMHRLNRLEVAESPDMVQIKLKDGKGNPDGRVVHFSTIPHGWAQIQKPTGTVYELQIHYPSGEYYNSYPYFPMKFGSPLAEESK